MEHIIHGGFQNVECGITTVRYPQITLHWFIKIRFMVMEQIYRTFQHSVVQIQLLYYILLYYKKRNHLN